MSLAEFAERVMVGAQHAAPLHQTPRSFLLSFDDGYESLATHAYPILADLGFSATTFVITDYVGKTIFEARAPVAGIVLYVCAVPSMTKGATIANIGVVAR